MVVISQRRRPISGSFVDVVEVSKALSQRETVAKVTETRARLIPRVPYFTHEWLTYPSDTVKRCQPSQLVVKGIGVDLTRSHPLLLQPRRTVAHDHPTVIPFAIT